MNLTLQRLVESRNEFTVVWLRFVQRFQKDTEAEIWIFEGKEDVDYYAQRIEQYYGTAIGDNVVLAGGKQNALKLRNELVADASFSSARVAFFIDADFDDPATLTGRDTYVTPCYSIENLYVSTDVFERYLTERLALYEDGDRAELQQVLSKIAAWRDHAVEAMLPFSALMKIGKSVPDHSAELCAFLRNRFHIDVVQISRAYGVPVHVKIDAVALAGAKMQGHPITSRDITAQIHDWLQSGKSPLDVSRGKFLLPLIADILAVALEDSNKKKERQLFSKRRHCGHQIRQSEFLSTVSRHARTPQCLIDFLKELGSRWKGDTPALATA